MSRGRSLTSEQRAAVERRRGPFALAAGAGSGKTSVLVERYVRAVVDDGTPPSRILAITFTDRAAGELRERVRRSLIDAGRRDAARESAGAFVATFHGFCLGLLRGHAVLAGLAADFALLGDAQAATLRDASFRSALERWLELPGALELAAAFDVSQLRDAISAVYDELRSRGERAPRLPRPHPRHDVGLARAALASAARAVALDGADDATLAALEACAVVTDPLAPPPSISELRALVLPRHVRAGADEYERARDVFEEACGDAQGAAAVESLDLLLRGFGEAFQARKRAAGMLDFDDLELEALALLGGHEDVRRQWSERFELIMVDELQDTNARQVALLDELERDNLFTVGDEFQSIYGFRHADVELFRRRQARLGALGAAGVLATNFRSVEPLLAATAGVFASRFGEGFAPLLAGRPDHPDAHADPVVELCVTDQDGWEPHEERLGVELAPAPLWRRAEARLLAARIDELIGAGTASAEDVVILLRAAGSIGAYETALADLGHATLATAGGGFFERPEVVDLVAYVTALANPLDTLALYGVLSSPLCGADADALAELALAARERNQAVWDVLLSDPPGGATAAFVERFRAARAQAPARSLAAIVAAGVSDHAYELHLAGLHAPERRIANVRKLEQLAREFERREGRDLRGFARALVAGRVGSTHETEAPPPAAGTGAIRLMTIHAAKGLEFPVVCLADLAHPARHGDPPLLVGRDRVGLRLVTEARERVNTLAFDELQVERRALRDAEEARISYVAMTRARERLIVSGAARFASWPSSTASAIAWLGPALVPDLMSRIERGGGTAVVAGVGDVPVRLTLLTADRIDELLNAPPPAAEPPPAPEQMSLPGVAATAAASPPPSSAARHPGALSYTAVAEYERCPYRFYLQRVLGMPDVAGVGDGSAAAARGVAVHALLETLDFAAPRGASVEAVAAAAASAGVELGRDEDRAAVAALVEAFAHSPLCARLAAASDVRRELPFAFAHDGELVRGFFDVAGVERDGTMLIVDYKSDRLDEAEDLAAHLERDYAIQRIVYALAGLASGVAPSVEVAHCFLARPEVSLGVRYTREDRVALEAQLTARLEPLRAGRYEVSPAPGPLRCGTCPGRARLCSHEQP